MSWFKVISPIPVCVNYENGTVVSFPRGKFFEASDSLPTVKRLLSQSPPALAPMGQLKPDPAGYDMPSPAGMEPPAVQPTKIETLPPNVNMVVRSTDKPVASKSISATETLKNK